MADEDALLDPAPESSLYASVSAAAQERRSRRRKQAVVGVAGAAALLAGAGFLVVQLMNANRLPLSEPAAQAPWTLATSQTTPTTVQIEPFATRTPKALRSAQPVERSPMPSPEPSDQLVPGGGQVSAGGIPGGPETQAGVSERTEILENGTIRIVTGRQDLTGHRELRMAGDTGRLVGSGVRCTGDVRMATGVPADRRPTLLLCWRTSPTRSVITLAVVPQGEPPTASSVAVIGREWAGLA
jgi:hypothetical protein